MNKTHLTASIIFWLGMALASCSSEVSPHGEEKAEDIQLSVDKTSLSFDTERSANIRVTVPQGVAWEATTTTSWISISTKTGTGSGNITISVSDDNPSTSPRTGIVTLNSSRYNRSVNIQVEQAGTRLTADPKQMDLLTSGGSRTLTIESNSGWYVKSKPSWVSLSALDGRLGTSSITVTATANESTEGRSGELVLETTNKVVSQTVNVMQSPVSLQLSEEKVSVLPMGATNKVNITCNSHWTVRSNADWCKVSPNNGTDNGTITITTEANNGTTQRTAIVTVQSGSISRTVSVEQESATLSLSLSQLNFSSEADNQIVAVTSNTTWTAVSNQDWCTIESGSATGNGTFTVRVAANTQNSLRQATVTVIAGGLTLSVSITQQAAVIKPGEGDNPTPQYSRKQK